MLTTNDVQYVVISCLAETIGRDAVEIDVTINLADIGIDSLALLRLQLMLEEKFDVLLPEDLDLDKITGQDITNLIQVSSKKEALQ